MMKLFGLVFLVFAVFFNQSCKEKSVPKSLIEYVDPMIGVITGNTFPTAVYPFGMVSPGPFLYAKGAKNIDSISGFSHIHTSGVGCGEKWGSIVVCPYSGEKLMENR